MLRSLTAIVCLVSLSACAAPSEVDVATAALSDHAVATRAANGDYVVLESRLRHDVEGLPVILFEVEEVGGEPYLVRLVDHGDRRTRNYVAVRAEGNDLVFDEGASLRGCGWCHSDDGNCQECYYVSTGSTGLQVCSCDAEDGDGVQGCTSTSEGVGSFIDVFAPAYF